MSQGDPVAPWARVFILISATVAAGALSFFATGAVVPEEPQEALIFQSGLLLVVLGSAVIEHKFTRPGDSVVNGLFGMISLVTVYAVAPRTAWWMVFGYCGAVFLLALVCSVVSTGPNVSGWKRRVADVTYEPSVKLGRARLLYSVVFLFGVFSFYETGSREAAFLVAFWGIFIVLWPLGFPEFLTSLVRTRRTPTPLGRVVRREWPDLVRVELAPGVEWSESNPRVYQDADGDQHLVIPLYKQLRDQQAIATGLYITHPGEKIKGLEGGYIYDTPHDSLPSREQIKQALGADDSSQLVGFVIEGSEIGAIRFETWRPDVCREGLLVWCQARDEKVFYQITEGLTREESLESDRLGSQFGVAAQMGTLDANQGFTKFDWLPTMNSPVFAESEAFGKDVGLIDEDDFVYGTVPGTGLRVGGAFVKTIDFHTAILGVTGSGKTELAFELIRHAAEQEVKVFCIDLTARYAGRLDDLTPRNLSLSAETTEELSKKLFAVESGKYGGADEKKPLQELREKLHKDITARIEDFLTSPSDNARVGLITLNEISNTQATLVVTELFMTCLLNYARDHADDCPLTLVVVEEAHTVMPEPSTMGLGDFGSKGLVSKIAQIALQGRKYRVGLLVIAQRTATVSKNVLTQCNTVIALNSFDETTVGFLSNVYGKSHAETLKDLPQLHAVVFGKGVRSQRPIIVKIPYVPEKDPEGTMASSAEDDS